MTIEKTGGKSGKTAVVRTTECPMCNKQIKRQEGLANHIRNNCGRRNDD